MAADVKAQAMHDAARDVMKVAKKLLDLADGVLQPVAGNTEPHTDTIAAIKTEAITVFDEWDIAKAALDAAKTA